jgi:hypothetical protein
MATPSACANCNTTGLPILPVRYTVVPAALNPTFPNGITGKRVKDVALDPKQYQYALRTLRGGFVYLFYAKGPRGSNYWEAYSVAPAGKLFKQIDALAPIPRADASCSSQGHISARPSYICIEQPEKCGTVWIAFSEHKWSAETIKEYAGNKALREKRMQAIEPAAWINGPAHEHAAEATQANLEKVLEYIPGLDASALSPNVPAAVSKEDGSYSPHELTRQSTRYPVFMRNDAAGKTTECKETIKLMHYSGKRSDGKSHPPMILALWDAVGITHELNGYRNEAAGRIDQYGKERELEVTTLSAIEGVRKALEDSAVADQGALQTNTARSRSAGWTAQDAQERRNRAQKLPEPQRTRELALVTQLDQDAKDGIPSYLSAKREHANQLKEPQRSIEMAKVDQEIKQFAAKRNATGVQNIDDARAQAWPKYEEKLDKTLFDPFKKNYDYFLEAADKIIDARTVELIKWLESPLFIDTIEDCHTTNIADGIEFENKIGTAVFGISSTKSGAKKIEEWIKQGKASEKSNLVWRAMALNQQAGIQEVDAALAHAKTTDIVLTSQSWAAATASVKWNKLADLYKKSQALSNTNIRAAAPNSGIKPFNTFHIDSFFITIGDKVLGNSFAKKVDSVVSEKVMQTLFLLRAGGHVDDVLDLVETQAKLESIERAALMNRLRTAQAFANVMEDGSGKLRPNAEVLGKKWEKLAANADKAASDGRLNAAKDARIALVVALFEAFNLAKCGYDAGVKRDGKALVVLTSSVMATVSAGLDVYTNVVKGTLEEASMTFQKLKFLGGALSAGASFFSAGVAFMDYQKASSDGHKNLARLYLTNSILTFSGGIAGVLTTLTYCGPYLANVATKQGLRAGANAAARAAAARAAAALAVRWAMYRAAFMALGLGLNLIALGIQLAIWRYTNNELQDWCEKCVFGIKRKEGSKNIEQQMNDYFKATYAIGVGK